MSLKTRVGDIACGYILLHVVQFFVYLESEDFKYLQLSLVYWLYQTVGIMTIISFCVGAATKTHTCLIPCIFSTAVALVFLILTIILFGMLRITGDCWRWEFLCTALILSLLTLTLLYIIIATRDFYNELRRTEEEKLENLSFQMTNVKFHQHMSKQWVIINRTSEGLTGLSISITKSFLRFRFHLFCVIPK